MTPFIELDGISSVDKNLGLLSCEFPVRTERRMTFERMNGRLRALEGKPTADDMTIKLTLATLAQSKKEAAAVFDNVAEWMYNARFLRVWSRPQAFYEGHFTRFSEIRMTARAVGEFTAEFTCNPPCAQRAVGVAEDWVPSRVIPIPEQITDAVKSAKTHFNAPGTLTVEQCREILSPALFLKIEGSWGDLTIGKALHVTEHIQTPLFIDADAMECYTVLDGKRVNIRHGGDFPQSLKSGLHIGGENLDITVMLLAVERS